MAEVVLLVEAKFRLVGKVLRRLIVVQSCSVAPIEDNNDDDDYSNDQDSNPYMQQ